MPCRVLGVEEKSVQVYFRCSTKRKQPLTLEFATWKGTDWEEFKRKKEEGVGRLSK